MESKPSTWFRCRMVAPRKSDWMGFEAGDASEAAQACQIHHAGLCATYLDPDWHLHVGVVEIEDHGRWFARSFREDGLDPDGKPLRQVRRGGAFQAPPPKERAPLAAVDPGGIRHMAQTSDSIAAAILRLDARGAYTEDDHHQLQELAPPLARAWLERRAEYRPGLPPAAAIEAHAARGGCWQHRREDYYPRVMRLRVKHQPFLTEGCAPEIQGLFLEATGWFRVEGTGWRTTADPLRRAALRSQDLTEGCWRPCSFPDGDPLPWPGEVGPAPALADRTEEALRVVVRFPFHEMHQPLKQVLEAHPCLGAALQAYARRDLRGCATELRAVLTTWLPHTTAGARDREQLTVWAWILDRTDGGC